jgi:hypothetical protein
VVEAPHLQDRQTQTPEALEQTVERRLVGDRPAQQRRPVAAVDELQAGERGRPPLVQVSLYPDAIVFHPNPRLSRVDRRWSWIAG